MWITELCGSTNLLASVRQPEAPKG